jgi:hypothetical protein
VTFKAPRSEEDYAPSLPAASGHVQGIGTASISGVGVNNNFNLAGNNGYRAHRLRRAGGTDMSLETFARQYWLASSFLKGRSVPGPMNGPSAESCLRDLASRCRWRTLRRAARDTANAHGVLPRSDSRAEWLLPCDTEPEAAP